jgi:hypothetical protein
MRTVILLHLLVTCVAFCNQIDRVCLGGYCQTLEVENGTVRFVDPAPPSKTLVIGSYRPADQDLIPTTEASIRRLDSPHGWRIVVSAFLDHDEDEVRLRLRFFSPDKALLKTEDVLSALEQAEIGRLLGTNDEILAITSNEEHAYNAQTQIWYLPGRGNPKLLLATESTVLKFSRGTETSAPGVTVGRETYDGVHAETKGRVPEFWAWDPKTKTLILRTK